MPYAATTSTEKLRFLDSAISALERDSTGNANSLLARALVMRAQVHLDDDKLSAALTDAQRATRYDDTQWQGRAWRCMADVHTCQGHTEAAIQALEHYQRLQPELTTKIRTEVRALQEQQQQQDATSY